MEQLTSNLLLKCKWILRKYIPGKCVGEQKLFVGDQNSILILQYSVCSSRKAVLLCEAITKKLFFVIDWSGMTDYCVTTIHFAVVEQMCLSVMNAATFHQVTVTQIQTCKCCCSVMTWSRNTGHLHFDYM